MDHQLRLKHLCRICGLKIPLNARSYDKFKHSDAIWSLLSINCEADDPCVHPHRICEKCRLGLSRQNVSKLEVNNFLPHQPNCGLCSRKRGRPKSGKEKGENDIESEKGVKNGSVETEASEQDFLNVIIHSLNVDRFSNYDVAHTYLCLVCQAVPCVPIVTSCSHVFCKECMTGWMSKSSACPSCRSILEESDISPLHGQLLKIYETLSLGCIYCNESFSMFRIKELEDHEITCQFLKKKVYDVSSRAKIFKLPLLSVSAKHARHKHLKPVISHVDDFCAEHSESKSDVLFFLLKDTLKSQGDSRWKDVERIWSGGLTQGLNVEQCLALRVDLLQSKGQYKSQYDFLKFNGIDYLSPPCSLDNAEIRFYPFSSNFSISDDKNNTLWKSDLCSLSDPLSITNEFSLNCPEMPLPNCLGVRWTYHHALASSLTDLDHEICSGLKKHGIFGNNNVILQTTVKDGCDGMGDVSVYKEQSYKFLPDKAFRYSFCILKVQAILNGQIFDIFEEESPNSVRTNRPLLEAISDENNKCSNVLCISPIEKERDFLKQNFLVVETSSGVFKHKITFFNSMVDEKRDRADSGLQGSGSNYLCTLCYADRSSAKSKVGSFSITRTFEETARIGEFIRVNPNMLSDNEIKKLCKGVKGSPISNVQPMEKCIDATHCDINMGQFFKKIIIREMAQVNKWAETQDVKKIIQDAEAKLDFHLKSSFGINPKLMMPGNYARTLFTSDPSVVCGLVSDANRKELLEELFKKFSLLRKVYRCNNPLREFPLDVKSYKINAVSFGMFLRDNFSYVEWTNYVHKIIEHVQQLIEDPRGPGSIGMFSSEGNEAGNKLFRHFRKNLSSRSSTLDSLRDVIKLHWLYSCKYLCRLAEVEHKQYKCSLCFQKGHNSRNCKILKESSS